MCGAGLLIRVAVPCSLHTASIGSPAVAAAAVAVAVAAVAVAAAAAGAVAQTQIPPAAPR